MIEVTLIHELELHPRNGDELSHKITSTKTIEEAAGLAKKKNKDDICTSSKQYCER